MNPIDRLLAIEAIKTVFARRLRYMDTGQWHLYAGLHTTDAVSETFSHASSVVGAQAIADAIRNYMTGGIVPITSAHHAHTPEIELLSDSEATGIWPMEDHLWWRNGAQEEHLHGYGHYHERYSRVDGQWLIAWRKLTRLRIDHTPAFFSRIS